MMKMMGFDPMGSMPVGLNIEFKLHCLRKDFLMIFIFKVCTWSWWRQEGGRRFDKRRTPGTGEIEVGKPALQAQAKIV